MATVSLNNTQLETYKNDGYLVVKGLFSQEEIDKLYNSAIENAIMQKNAMDLNDQTGKKTKLTLWFTPGDDVFGYLIRSERIVNQVWQLLGNESAVCHFHTKLLQKESRVGGAWEWHQDYGYWYKNQFMFPDELMSVMVALTAANKENGCLQVIKGSHKMGRLNHGFAGEQVGADMEMVNHALKTMDLVYCELEPGDALFFHSNLIHRSEANTSDQSRWSLISCYNSQSNIAYSETSNSWKVPVSIVPDRALLEWNATSFENADFLKKENDPALKATGWENEVKTG